MKFLGWTILPSSELKATLALKDSQIEELVFERNAMVQQVLQLREKLSTKTVAMEKPKDNIIRVRTSGDVRRRFERAISTPGEEENVG